MKNLTLQDRFFKNRLGGYQKEYLFDSLKRVIHANLIKDSHGNSRNWLEFSNMIPILEKKRKKNGKALSRYLRTIQNESNIESKALLVSSYLTHLKNNYSEDIIKKIEPRYSEIESQWNSSEWLDVQLVKFGYPTDKIDRFNQLNILFNLHYSIKDDSLIAYYPSLKHYREGREVRTRLGKFLARFKDDLQLDDDEIKKVVDNFNADVIKDRDLKLTILDDNEENQYNWANVYQNNRHVHSCMTHKPNAIRTYCSGFNALKLAYLTNGEGEVVSRTIIRDDDEKGYIRFYPSTGENKYSLLLKNMLEEKGFNKQVDLNGVLLKAIEDEHGNYYAPYLDGEANYGTVEPINDKFYIQIGYDGDYCLDNTSGYLSDNMNSCESCGDTHHEEDMSWIGDYLYCSHCSEENFCYSDYHGEYLNRDEAVWVESMNDYFHENDSYIVWVESEGEHYHEDDVVFCDFTEEAILNDNSTVIMFYINNGDYFEDFNERKITHEEDVRILPNGERVYYQDYNRFISLLNGGA